MKEEKNESLWIWGYHPVNEFLHKSPETIEMLYCLPSFDKKKRGEKLIYIAHKKGIKTKKVNDFNKFFNPSGVNHQGIAAIIRNNWEINFSNLKEILDLQNKPVLILLDGVTDPQNLGAIIRSCASMGVEAVLLPEKGSVSVTSTVARVSSGAISQIKVCYLQNTLNSIDTLKEMGFKIVAMTPEASQKLWEVNLFIPVVLVFGAEGEGIRYNLKKKCDINLSIPLKNLGSLNVASSCSIALYEIIRQRESDGLS